MNAIAVARGYCAGIEMGASVRPAQLGTDIRIDDKMVQLG